MAIQNDFLPFAVGPGANVLSQSSYEVLAALASGFMTGTAQSAACNKVWRQSTVMAAVMAAFIVERTGQPVIDDGTTATILANLLASTAAANGDATKLFQVETPPAGDNSNDAASTAFVQGFAGGRKVVILSITPWTVPAGVTDIWVSACAGAGGGAGSPNIPANNIVAGGAGGGAGQFVLRYHMTVMPGQVLSCTPGAGGVAGAVGGAGGNGSNTTVGSLTLTAGAGGQVGSSGTPTQAWPGQPGGNGFPNGEYGQDTSQYGPGATGGRGGAGPFGASGAPGRGAIGGVANLIAPSASYGYGVGGSGAGGCYGPTTATGTTSGTVGAAGMPGFIVIEY
ncbi:phage tail protein [Burkholderia gladioli]|uniref:glycine-rich domain-containing protein n=1 Tax=Burkholderia gladioli TaxID=28095 RepID=UPI001C235B66|nr:phage tail protein [Burkholderia gladioli]